MATRIHQALRVSKNDLKKEGIFNGFVDIDNKFYIDPHLLQKCKIPDFTDSYPKFKQYFEDILKILSQAKEADESDRFFREAIKKLTFHESPNLALGYSSKDIAGSGIGKGLAKNLATTAKQIIDAGIEDTTIFELIGLIEEGLGADRISDMTSTIIYEDILSFNDRMSKQLSLNTEKTKYDSSVFAIPSTSKFGNIILLPKKILRDLPVALDWTYVDVVAAHNSSLRHEVNNIIGDTWKDAKQRLSKKELKQLLLRRPELIQDLIRIYNTKDESNYDFKNDPNGQIIWHEIAKNYANHYTFRIATKIQSAEDVFQVVKEICKKFKNLIEDNGLNKLLYDSEDNRRHESFAQLLFYGIAESYCEANDIDISPEVNSGRGAVDFKFSKGFTAKVNVEVKYTSNRKLYKGYTTQLPIYNRQEKTKYSIYLILETSETSNALERIYKLNNKESQNGKRIPEIITADALPKDSASKV